MDGEEKVIEYDSDEPNPPADGSAANSAAQAKSAGAKSNAKAPSYAVMVLEAVVAMNEKGGSSLNAIRKYILTHYNVGNKQTASFNSLTLKAVNRAVAANELEKVKHSFKLSVEEKERRKEQERRALGAAAAAAAAALESVSSFLPSHTISSLFRSLRHIPSPRVQCIYVEVEMRYFDCNLA